MKSDISVISPIGTSIATAMRTYVSRSPIEGTRLTRPKTGREARLNRELDQTKQAVERQDGKILVESVEGHGATTFTVKLPLRTDVERPSLGIVR
jgi:hypothetical protein